MIDSVECDQGNESVAKKVSAVLGIRAQDRQTDRDEYHLNRGATFASSLHEL